MTEGGTNKDAQWAPNAFLVNEVEMQIAMQYSIVEVEIEGVRSADKIADNVALVDQKRIGDVPDSTEERSVACFERCREPLHYCASTTIPPGGFLLVYLA